MSWTMTSKLTAHCGRPRQSCRLPQRARPKGTEGLARNLRLRDGRYYWHWDPAFFFQMAGAPGHIDRAGRQFLLRAPTEADAKRVADVSQTDAPQVGDEVVEGWEGCLSIPDWRGVVPRYQSLEVRGLDRHGQPVHYQASGFFARVIQHEVDHLNGAVYLDAMPDLKTLTHLREFERYWLSLRTD